MSAPFVYVGSLAVDMETLKRMPEADTIAAETKIVLQMIEEKLEKQGLTLRDVVKTSCYLSDAAHQMEFIEAYKEVFAPGPYPARTTVVLGIAVDCRVQIEVVAATPALA